MTPRQLAILRHIDKRLADGKLCPTLREMADAVGRSRVTIWEHVQRLIRNGYLSETHGVARSLVLTEKAHAVLHPPVRCEFDTRKELAELRRTAPRNRYGKRVCSVIDRLLATPA